MSIEALSACGASLAGVIAWVFYFRADLVLSHYDARAHLVVARRIIDNLTPGWQQIGAVWLPLPHVLLLLPVQNDLLYRTGLAGSAISLACLAATAWAVASLVRRTTGSAIGAAVAAMLLALNPNLLYLHTTPMTEPLLLAVTSLLVLWLYDWLESDTNVLPRKLGWLLVAAAWTRYEAWAVIAVAGVLASIVLVHRGTAMRRIAARAAAFAAWPAAAVAIFLVDSRITVGRWFVSDGFFVPDAKYAGQAGKTLMAIAEGTWDLSGYGVLALALIGMAAAVWKGARDKSWSTAWVAFAVLGSALLPFAAFYDGHPFRIRYMTPLVAAGALWCGMAIGLLPRRSQIGAAVALAAVALVESPPLSSRAPMVIEAQLDRPSGLARQVVSECLSRAYRGEKVLVSMGSLGHYMQELSWHGFALRDFVHEGNGIIWEAAVESGPAPHVGWMLVEEVAEGGDELARRIRRDPSFTNGMTQACAQGGVTLYRRVRR
jgi:hypothetical protein